MKLKKISFLGFMPVIFGLTLASCANDEIKTSSQESPESKLNVGDHYLFGAYEQDNDLSNGREAIDWIVVEKTAHEIVMLSDKGLDVKPYHDENASITWEGCTLRSWLNVDFYNAAFSPFEQGKIKLTQRDNPDNPEYGTPGGNDTLDSVYLLNIGEAETYFASDSARICEPTPYAVAQGADVSDGHCAYWLSSSGRNANLAAIVYQDGGVGPYGYKVNGSILAVRPALRLKI